MFKYMTKYQTTEYLQRFENSKIKYAEDDTNIERLENMSVDPLQYGMKKYSDIDIATHSIMIAGLPKKIPRRELEQKIKKMFT